MDGEKRKLKNRCFSFLERYGREIRTKMNNVCGKTGRYNVPEELFQGRTARKNRVLISWRAVRDNDLTIEQLESFDGGVVVEFINNDIFDDKNQNNPTFISLFNKIGSDDVVSSIISFRTEEGSSSSKLQRDAFEKFLDNTPINYNGREIIINEDNYREYIIEQVQSGGMGNEKWKGFLFVSIKGGQQDTIETHHDKGLTLFNPACEYANESVSLDIDLTLAYFVMKSISLESIEDKTEYYAIMDKMKIILSKINYCFNNKVISLWDYCSMHPSVRLHKDGLTDPIQIRKISIESFKIKDNSPGSVDLTHNEAVNLEKYYWDNTKRCILSPARPTNVFWSYHLSNMMQQNFTLNEYIEHEKEIYKKRRRLKRIYKFK